MRKFISLTMIFCLAYMVGCGGKNMLDIMNNPPEYPDAISASGTAPYSPVAHIMRDGAELSARAGIARIIGTRVQEVISRWAEENHSSIADGPAFNTHFESATQSIVDQRPAGARIKHWYYDKDTKTQYALAVYKTSDAIALAKAQLAETRKQIEEEEQAERLFISREEAERAFKELDELIEKQFQI